MSPANPCTAQNEFRVRRSCTDSRKQQATQIASSRRSPKAFATHLQYHVSTFILQSPCCLSHSMLFILWFHAASPHSMPFIHCFRVSPHVHILANALLCLSPRSMPFVHWSCYASLRFHSLVVCVHRVSTFLQMFRCACLTPCHSMSIGSLFPSHVAVFLDLMHL